jgi:hypothetical protein
LGILRGIKASFLEGNLSGLKQAAAILAGMIITSLGYVTGQIKMRPKLANSSFIKFL